MMGALIMKDLKLYFRNQFIVVVTMLGLAAFIALYYLLPAQPDDSLATAVHFAPGIPAEARAFLGEALESDVLASPEELLNAVEDGDYVAGVILTEEMAAALMAGDEITIPIYSAPGTTSDMERALRDIYTVGFNNLNLGERQKKVNVEDKLIVLGADMLGIGEGLALRERMLPMLLMMVFSIELIGMANLISEEVTRGTVQALLVTPLRTSQFFGAKMLVGLGLAFMQTLVLLAATGKLGFSADILLGTLLAGSLLMTGAAFFIAAFSRGFMSVMAWSVLFLLVLMLPGLSVMFPTMASDWIRVIPSHYLVDSLHRGLNYSAGWTDVRMGLLALLAWGAAFLAAGSWLLRRRFQ